MRLRQSSRHATLADERTNMERISVIIAPEPQRVRILARSSEGDLLKAVLGPPSQAHPQAARTLLEGLSLWHQQSLAVVLCVDDSYGGHALGLCDGLGFGERNLHYEVGIAPQSQTRKLSGIADFSDLRQLDHGQVLS